MFKARWLLPVCLAAVALVSVGRSEDPVDAMLPNESLKLPFHEDTPIVFVTTNSNAALWNKLSTFWSTQTALAVHPTTGEKVVRPVVAIKVPLGLTAAPPVPAENPMTVAKWNLGKKLYYDPILSSNATVACATCHNPAQGFTDQSQFSTGINGGIGGANAPTVLNSAFNRFQFWDGRAGSLEEQAQGPVGNPKEMFSSKGEPWAEAVTRLRANPEYVKAFQQVFGHIPTRDAAAKAIATYERTVLSGNSIFDRAEVAMRKRIKQEEEEGGGGKIEMKGVDFAAAIKEAVTIKDQAALKALDTKGDNADQLGQRLVNGRNLYFNKARCSNCHVGDTLTDHQFHNLGVGAKDGKLPKSDLGRFGSQPTGHKDPSQYGAFKTPGLRGLLSTAPYMHDGSEATLEAVVEFYNKGGEANPYLDEKMRDLAAEAAYMKAKAAGQPVDPNVKVFTNSGRPIIPFKLNLTKEESADLVLFLKSLEGDPLDPIVADPKKFAGK